MKMEGKLWGSFLIASVMFAILGAAAGIVYILYKFGNPIVAVPFIIFLALWFICYKFYGNEE